MKTALPESPATAPPAAANGTHRVAKKSGPSPKRSAVSDSRLSASPEPPAAPFAVAAVAPIDAEMWPLHSAVWFQPERAPSASQWSGLTVERRNRPPAPDFEHAGAAPLNRPGALDIAAGALMPGAQPQIPQSSLAPLGWDPRTVCRKEERE
jgi:hypothetical protein